MAWYSTVSEFAARQLSAIRPPDPAGEDGDAVNSHQFDGELMNGPGSAPDFRRQLSAEFFRPNGMVWSPTAADRACEAFDVSQPVAQPEDLRGREKELSRLLSGVLHRRNHGIVSGPRGSGKTSLVRVFGQFADREGVVVLYGACDGGTTFGELLREFFEQIPSSSVDADHVELLDQRIANFGRESTPHQATSILALIKYSQVVIVLDEFDRITNPAMHMKMASLLKLTSDARLPIRFVLVGGTRSFAEVVSQHPSLVRHITGLSTNPLSHDAVHELLDSCAERCGMKFSSNGKRLVEQVACGSPYHARLFGMHSALRALGREATEISDGDVSDGLAEAFHEWAALNREDAATFRSIVEGAHGSSQPYVEVARQFAVSDEQLEDVASMAGSETTSRHYDEEILAGFGTAVERSGNGAGFRDATAPQFLLALQMLSRPQGTSRQMKGLAGA